MIISALQSVRAPAMPGEYDIHALIAEALAKAGIAHVHERRLGARRRIDFMCGDIGIEVKKTRPDRRALIRQVEKYMESDEISALVLVSPRDVELPEAINGKPLARVSLNRLWGVALP